MLAQWILHKSTYFGGSGKSQWQGAGLSFAGSPMLGPAAVHG